MAAAFRYPDKAFGKLSEVLHHLSEPFSGGSEAFGKPDKSFRNLSESSVRPS